MATSSMPPTKIDYFELKGGLNLVTPPLAMPPGMLREGLNFEIAINGGYKRVDGYERFDGRTAPTDAVYYIISCTFSAAVAAGDVVTGVTSGATATVIAVTASYLAVTKVVGTFNSSEVLNVGGSPKATTTSAEIPGAAPTNDLNWQYLNLAGDVYRALIGAVPGSGSILGVVYYDGLTYAFRNNAGGTAAEMYKSSASGWTLVTTPALLPGGRYDFDIYDFGSGPMLYGADGVNKAFQFDGTTFTQITTGMTPDTPKLAVGHSNHLFLAFDNSLQHSAIGTPTSWTPVLGAGELNAGATITNLKPQPGTANGAAMAVYTRKGTKVLYGSSSSDWNLVTLDPDAGAFAYTAQHLGQTVVLDDRGITTLETTQNYGNFAAASISPQIRPYIIENKSRVVGSSLSRDKNQYRVFFTGGRALYYTQGLGFMTVLFPDELTCFYSGEDSDGNEILYAGSDNGYVYRMDRGYSFDGDQIEAYMNLVFNHLKSPRVVKRYRKAVLEVGGIGYSNFYMSAEFGYATGDYGTQAQVSLSAQLSAGYWDVGVWDAGSWDGRILAPVEFALTGAAENIALRIAQLSDYQPPLTFFGALMHFTPRRQLR